MSRRDGARRHSPAPWPNATQCARSSEADAAPHEDAAVPIAAADRVTTLPSFLTIAEVVERCRLSDSTIRRLIRRRDIAIHRVGGRVLISEPDLIAFLARTRRNARR